MNPATRTAVRLRVNKGHTPLAIFNGFRGLLEDHVQPLSWPEIDNLNWTTREGSGLSTSKTLPGLDLGAVASHPQEHQIDGLTMIGGFEVFNALRILEGRSTYPALNILWCTCLPLCSTTSQPLNPVLEATRVSTR